MVLCCGVCIEDVGDVLGSHRDSWIWRRVICMKGRIMMIWMFI